MSAHSGEIQLDSQAGSGSGTIQAQFVYSGEKNPSNPMQGLGRQLPTSPTGQRRRSSVIGGRRGSALQRTVTVRGMAGAYEEGKSSQQKVHSLEFPAKDHAFPAKDHASDNASHRCLWGTSKVLVKSEYEKTVDNILSQEEDDEEKTIEKVTFHPQAIELGVESENSTNMNILCCENNTLKCRQVKVQKRLEENALSGSLWSQCQLTLSWVQGEQMDDLQAENDTVAAEEGKEEEDEDAAGQPDDGKGLPPPPKATAQQSKKQLKQQQQEVRQQQQEVWRKREMGWFGLLTDTDPDVLKNAIALSDDGLVLAEVRSGWIYVKLCSREELICAICIDGEGRPEADSQTLKKPASLYSLNFSHDGARLVGCGQLGVRVWSAVNGALLSKFDAAEEVLATFSADDAVLWSLRRDESKPESKWQLVARFVKQDVVLHGMDDAVFSRSRPALGPDKSHWHNPEARARKIKGGKAHPEWTAMLNSGSGDSSVAKTTYVVDLIRGGLNANDEPKPSEARGTQVLRNGDVVHVRGSTVLKFNLLFPFVYQKRGFPTGRLQPERPFPSHVALRSKRADKDGNDEQLHSSPHIRKEAASLLVDERASLDVQGRVFACVLAPPLPAQQQRWAPIQTAASVSATAMPVHTVPLCFEVAGAQILARLDASKVQANTHYSFGFFAGRSDLNDVAVVPGRGAVVVYDLWHGEVVHVFEHDRDVNSVRVSEDGKLLTVAVSGKDGEEVVDQSAVLIYSIVTRQELWQTSLSAEVKEAWLHLPVPRDRHGDRQPSESSAFDEAFLSRPAHREGNHDEDACVVLKMDSASNACQSIKVGELYRVLDLSPGPESNSQPPPAPSWTAALLQLEQQVVKHFCIDDERRVACFIARDEGKGEDSTQQPRKALWMYNISDINAKHKSVSCSELVKEDVEDPPPSAADGSAPASWSGTNPQPLPPPRASGRAKNLALKAMALSGDGNLVAICHKSFSKHIVNVSSRAPAQPLSGRPPPRLGRSASGGSSASAEVGRVQAGTPRQALATSDGLPAPLSIELPDFPEEATAKAMCVSGKMLSVIADKPTPDGIESTVFYVNMLKPNDKPRRQMLKSRGQSVGLADGGRLRVGLIEETRTLVVQDLQSNETLMQFEEGKMRFVGVSSNGQLLVFVYNRKVWVRDLNNLATFGPSQETLRSWALGGGERALEALDPHKERLGQWPLFWRARWCESVEEVLSEAEASGDFSVLQLLVESCPALWAVVPYRWRKDPPTQKRGWLRKKERPHAVPRSLLEYAVQQNNRHLLQILLDAIVSSVGDTPAEVPIVQMDQITELIKWCLAQRKMLDKWDAFLKELPLVKIDVPQEDIETRFEQGAVFTTGWWCHHVFTASSPWSHRLLEKSRGGEKGYRYVVPLPGLADGSTLHEFVELTLDAALIDNESMRVTIDALEKSMTYTVPTPFGRMGVDRLLIAFTINLTCYCLFVYYVTTENKTRQQLLDSEEGKFGVGVGATAVALDLFFLCYEMAELVTSKSAMDWLKGGFWNVLPVVGHSLSIVSFVFVLTNQGETLVRVASAIVTVLLWFNLFNYLRAYRKGSALVTLLVQIMVDMVYFVGVVAVLVFCFSGGFYALHGKLDPEVILETPEDEWDDDQKEFVDSSGFLFSTLNQAVSRTFVSAVLAGFDLNEFRSPRDWNASETSWLSVFSFIFFFTSAILVTVVAMNALIALMGNTYARVSESEQAWVYKEIASVLYDKMRLKPSAAWLARRNRWTHVLSPSETGSRANQLGAKDSKDDVVRAAVLEVQQTTKELQLNLENVKSQVEQVQERIGTVDREVAELNAGQERQQQETQELRHELHEMQSAIVEQEAASREELAKRVGALQDEYESFKQSVHTGMIVVHDSVKHVRDELMELPARVGPAQPVRTVAVPPLEGGEEMQLGATNQRRRLWP